MLKVQPNFTPKKLLKLPKNLIFINGVTFVLTISTIPFSFKEFKDHLILLRVLHLTLSFNSQQPFTLDIIPPVSCNLSVMRS